MSNIYILLDVMDGKIDINTDNIYATQFVVNNK